MVGAALTGGLSALALALAVLQAVVAASSGTGAVEASVVAHPTPHYAPSRTDPPEAREAEPERENPNRPDERPPEPGDRRKLVPRQWRGTVPQIGPRPTKRFAV